MKLKFILPILIALVWGCEKEEMPKPVASSQPNYNLNFLGDYISRKSYSNGNEVTNLVNMNLKLPTGYFKQDYSEKNPATGISYTDVKQGGWHITKNLDTLYLTVTTYETVQVTTDWGASYQDVVHHDTDTMLVQKISPGMYSFKRKYKGVNQEFHMERL
jgi:hypothetical protein